MIGIFGTYVVLVSLLGVGKARQKPHTKCWVSHSKEFETTRQVLELKTELASKHNQTGGEFDGQASKSTNSGRGIQ